MDSTWARHDIGGWGARGTVLKINDVPSSYVSLPKGIKWYNIYNIITTVNRRNGEYLYGCGLLTHSSIRVNRIISGD